MRSLPDEFYNDEVEDDIIQDTNIDGEHGTFSAVENAANSNNVIEEVSV